MLSNKKVKKLLIDQDLSIAKLAETTGYSRVHLSNVINGHFESPKARQRIAEALNQDFGKLWGEQNNALL